jgi:hypothetical protein
MNPFESLVKVISEVIPGFNTPNGLDGHDMDLILLDEYNSEPVVISKKKIIIYTKTEQGARLKDWVFKNDEQLAEKGQLVIPKDFAEMIEEASPFATTTEDDQKLLDEMRGKIPNRDLDILSDSLFIRRLAGQDKPVSKFREIMSTQYGTRGRNISNLTSENYYENYILPLYNFLCETDKDNAQAVFSEIYEEAVTLYPFAVFVSKTKKRDAIKDEIRQKIFSNLNTGQHILNVHGIGSINKNTILDIIADEDIKRLFISEPDIVRFKQKIYVRLHF